MDKKGHLRASDILSSVHPCLAGALLCMQASLPGLVLYICIIEIAVL